MRGRFLITIVIVLFTLFFGSNSAFALKPVQTIHVFVALCDNKNQGIAPVPSQLGNGDDPRNNLYWGALYGVKTFFKKSDDWNLISNIKDPDNGILERCVFRHRNGDVYLIADAYRGINIKQAVIDFLESASGEKHITVSFEQASKEITLDAGGKASLLAYVGHDGLMDFQLDSYPKRSDDTMRDVIILACISRSYFAEPIHHAGANPLLWTTGLMAPEAYTLKNAIDGWILHETGEEISLRAAKAYQKYQDCSLNAARNLFVTGW